ncbi:MAG: nucleotidyltransferase domain-containing protein [Armatimonadetes bacterium]|nr:nucleotidyltransferase domain-containing protein [Armatimonadota bacterium]
MIDLIRDNLDKIRALCEQHHVQRLDVFGSAADGRYREGESDLDFIVRFDALAPEELCDAFFDLLFALEDHFDRKIDLVMPQPPERANPYFVREMEKSRQVIYERELQEAPV